MGVNTASQVSFLLNKIINYNTAVNPPKIGDLVISSVNYYVARITSIFPGSGTCNTIGCGFSIKGAKGDTGATGPQGPAGADGLNTLYQHSIYVDGKFYSSDNETSIIQLSFITNRSTAFSNFDDVIDYLTNNYSLQIINASGRISKSPGSYEKFINAYFTPGGYNHMCVGYEQDNFFLNPASTIYKSTSNENNKFVSYLHFDNRIKTLT